MFAYGFLSVVLVVYLAELGLSEGLIGLLLSLTLIGDAAISLWMTTSADRFGRRRILIAGAGLMVLAGVLFALTDRVALLLIAAIIGVISPSGYEVGPFLAVEQAALSQIIPDERRAQVFSWYNLVGSFATAAGALAGGGTTELLQEAGMLPLNSYRTIVILYGAIGLLLALLFTRLSSSIETAHSDSARTWFPLGLHRSRRVVLKLSALFGLDAFAGGFVVQSLIAYCFHTRLGAQPAALGGIFFGANNLAAKQSSERVKVWRRLKKFGVVQLKTSTYVLPDEPVHYERFQCWQKKSSIPADFRGRKWGTRPHPEIDRVGSAWLIHRFIDAGAKFVFANTPAEFPEAIPYDMFELEFSHQGDRCTFETLIERFGIRDKAVLPIAQLIRLNCKALTST